VENLERMRFFYQTYTPTNSATPLRNLGESAAPPAQQPEFRLSWSHYIRLMRIENPEERRFYELECVQNNWSLKELQRQFDSALYERLALSRNKAQVKQLAEKGQQVQQPQDVIKDPYVLEFLGLKEEAAYSESNLENRIIDEL
jgi:predicted nuclease of restriction endonuclease-like (RecB) superfamily